jgi:hypothetical protein
LQEREEDKMMNGRQLLKLVPAATVAGALFTVSGRTLQAEIPAMSKESQSNMTPEQALGAPKDGNERFVNGKMLQHNLIAQVREKGDIRDIVTFGIPGQVLRCMSLR